MRAGPPLHSCQVLAPQSFRTSALRSGVTSGLSAIFHGWQAVVLRSAGIRPLVCFFLSSSFVFLFSTCTNFPFSMSFLFLFSMVTKCSISPSFSRSMGAPPPPALTSPRIAGKSAVFALPVGNILGCLLVVFSTLDYRALSPRILPVILFCFTAL